ncbi:MAG: hypothetical protein WA634_12090 [Silvibacterium sp.]
MAWIETFFCNVCNKAKSEEADDWWLAWEEAMSPTPKVEQPVLKVTHWNEFLSHDAGVKHLCGARCAQTLLDRWMHAIGD